MPMPSDEFFTDSLGDLLVAQRHRGTCFNALVETRSILGSFFQDPRFDQLNLPPLRNQIIKAWGGAYEHLTTVYVRVLFSDPELQKKQDIWIECDALQEWNFMKSRVDLFENRLTAVMAVEYLDKVRYHLGRIRLRHHLRPVEVKAA